MARASGYNVYVHLGENVLRTYTTDASNKAPASAGAHYFNGASSITFNPWFSAGKTLTAFTVGLAQQDGHLSIDEKVSNYLGEGWTNMPMGKENLITIKNQLTMTSGGDFSTLNWNCTDSECLEYLHDAGSYWFYYNAFYTLIQPVLDAAIPGGFENYFHNQLETKIGLNGFWLKNGYNSFYVSLLQIY